MSTLALALILTATPLPTQTEQDPARVVRHAVAAVEGDSVSVLERRWSRAVTRRDPMQRVLQLGLATLAHYTYRDSVAEQFYRSLLPSADRTAGYAAHGLARLSILRGALARADSAAAAALAAARAAGDTLLTAEALITLALVRSRTSGPPAAHPLLDEAESLAPATAYRVQALSRCARGQALMYAGDARALEVAFAGAELAARAADARARASCLAVAATEYIRRNQSDSALHTYNAAVAEYRRARDRAGLASALQWRSYLYLLIGSLGHARRDAGEAVAEAEAAHAQNVLPWARSTLAKVAFQLGDATAAAEHATATAALFAAQGDRYGAINARELEGALNLAIGEAARARETFAQVVTLSREIGWIGGEIPGHIGLMHVAFTVADLAAARRELAAAVSNAASAQRPLSSVEYYEGVLALHAGNLSDAERSFRAGVVTAVQSDWRYLYRARLAEVLARQGLVVDAERELVDAAHALDDWREQLQHRDLRLLAFQLAEDRADPDLGVATVVATLAGAGRVAPAFELVERGRARDLSDRLVRARALDTLDAAGAAPTAHAVPLDSLRRVLPDDATAILEYVTGRLDPTTLFVITRRDVRTYQLPSQDSLARVIARLVTTLESGDDPRALGGVLGAALLAPALAGLDPAVRRLIVVPDGPLHRVPFDVLVLPDDRFAIERFAISTAPSASVAVRLWASRSAPPPTGIAVLADPRFARETDTTSADADVFRSARMGAVGLPRLRASTREARAVSRYARAATVRRRADASESWLKGAALDSYGVLHFATHALVDEGSLTNTALALAPSPGEDGFVGPGELASLALAAELVVLSACRTASGVIVRGEGVQGLATALLAAGARAIAVSWWPISDNGTVRLMNDFYRAMSEGKPVAEALQAAKLAALRRGAPAREWAAFTIIGDPLARPALEPPAVRMRLWLSITAVLTALLSVVLGVWRPRRTALRRNAQSLHA